MELPPTTAKQARSRLSRKSRDAFEHWDGSHAQFGHSLDDQLETKGIAILRPSLKGDWAASGAITEACLSDSNQPARFKLESDIVEPDHVRRGIAFHDYHTMRMSRGLGLQAP